MKRCGFDDKERKLGGRYQALMKGPELDKGPELEEDDYAEVLWLGLFKAIEPRG